MHPDFTGKILLGDGEHYLDAWIREGKHGKFFSGKIGRLIQKRVAGPDIKSPPIKRPSQDFDDDLPF